MPLLLKLPIVRLPPRLSAKPTAPGKPVVTIRYASASLTSIVTICDMRPRVTVPNMPVPGLVNLLFVSVRLHFVADQNPAHACPGTRPQSKPDNAGVVASQTAQA